MKDVVQNPSRVRIRFPVNSLVIEVAAINMRLSARWRDQGKKIPDTFSVSSCSLN